MKRLFQKIIYFPGKQVVFFKFIFFFWAFNKKLLLRFNLILYRRRLVAFVLIANLYQFCFVFREKSL